MSVAVRTLEPLSRGSVGATRARHQSVSAAFTADRRPERAAPDARRADRWLLGLRPTRASRAAAGRDGRAAARLRAHSGLLRQVLHFSPLLIVLN